MVTSTPDDRSGCFGSVWVLIRYPVCRCFHSQPPGVPSSSLLKPLKLSDGARFRRKAGRSTGSSETRHPLNLKPYTLILKHDTRHPSVKPSSFLFHSPQKLFEALFNSNVSDPFHNVVFDSACRDRLVVTGRRTGMKMLYWIQTTL